MGKPKSAGPSKQQLKLQREQSMLAQQQRKQIEEQNKALQEQEEQSRLEAERQRNQRISGQSASARRSMGRRSLIGTGGELGTESQLG